MRDASTVLRAIETFHPARSPRAARGEEWLDLHDLTTELATAGATDADMARVLLGVFERFPRHDGYEVFWTLLHRIEALSGYERELIASVGRVPNEMGLTMLRRILNTGVTRVDDVDLEALVSELAPHAPAIDFYIEPPG
jgi:hypothetical protein